MEGCLGGAWKKQMVKRTTGLRLKKARVASTSFRWVYAYLRVVSELYRKNPTE